MAENKEEKTEEKTEEKKEEKISKFKQLKNQIKKYGFKGLILYELTYIFMVGLFYFLFSYNFIKTDNEYLMKIVDVKHYEEKYGREKIKFLIAFAVNEPLEIIRIPLVIYILSKYIKK